MGADGQLNLLTRKPGLRQAQKTPALNDSQIHVRNDVAGVFLAKILRVLLLIQAAETKLEWKPELWASPFDNGQAVVTAFNKILETAMGSSRSCSKINPPPSDLPLG